MNETTIHLETCKLLRNIQTPFVTMDWRGEKLPERKARALEQKSFGGAGIPDLLIPMRSKAKWLEIKTNTKLVDGMVDASIYPNGLAIEFKSSLTEVFNNDGSIIYSTPRSDATKKVKLQYWHNLIQFAFMGFFIQKGFYATYAANSPPYGLIENWLGLDWARMIEPKNLYSPIEFFGVIGCNWAFVEAVKEYGPSAYKGHFDKLPIIKWERYM